VVQLEFFGELPQFMRLFISGMVCLAAYLAVVVGIFRITGPLHLAFSVLRDFRAVRSPAST
jgi:PST family polysaccharide transporter